jgi:Patatin-like phospholipase
VLFCLIYFKYNLLVHTTVHLIYDILSNLFDQIVDEEIPTDAKLAFFNETRHAYGRTALLLSGGAYLGFYHIGVVKALFLEGLLPRVVSGASAGSLVAAMVGTKSDAELR